MVNSTTDGALFSGGSVLECCNGSINTLQTLTQHPPQVAHFGNQGIWNSRERQEMHLWDNQNPPFD
ncbi:MAG TPA: hypothetical protein VFE02_18875 [Candidatus Acidoferrales bacterium]|jgi:hypothetical protein|nr:hypothetical protein [Candidatus Acidoferrales bacterium]